ncbi:DNA-directed RNA polymerase subunit beta [Tokyovirus A1]|uniref:DNA-directed RNA polymerase subunit beta n=1 Tax=Tokyovirus A1 TaxID=1826170 RepID=UPI0007A98116|nr:DNA-directed RNA polymerase subunit beta [Tokyovirus A1]BAU79885.1 DNA-directed RNA polymerase subunit beta [Tokyovirus A1]
MDALNDKLWKLFKVWFSQTGPAHHQIQAYNEFVQELLPNIIREKGRVEIDREEEVVEDEDEERAAPAAKKKKSWFQVVEFTNPTFGRVTYREVDDRIKDIFPSDARRRGIPYSAPFYCDIIVTTADGETAVYEQQTIAEIPVMVRSCLCNLTRYNLQGDECRQRGEDPTDRGGYFIVEREIIVVCSERGAFGRVYTYADKQANKKMPKYEVHSEIRISATSNTRTTTVYVGLENGVAMLYAQHLSEKGIPLCVVLEAMGISYLDLLKFIKAKNLTKEQRSLLIPSLEHARAMFPHSRKQRVQTMAKALVCMGYKNPKGIDDLPADEAEIKLAVWVATLSKELCDKLFPCYKETDKKVWFMCYMLARALKVKTGDKKPEDRDHYTNKRIDCVDSLLNNLFYSMWNQTTKFIKDSCKGRERTADPLKPIHSKNITKKIRTAMSTGNWSSFNTKTKKQGTSQLYERMNGVASASNLRKVHAAIGTEGNMTKPRRVHESSYGFICPPDTPESKDKTGLSKVLALSATVSLGCTIEECFEILSALEDFSQDFGLETFVFLNGVIMGSTDSPKALVEALSVLKRAGNFFWDCCFVFDEKHNEVRVNCDAGRLVRPLMVVKDGKLEFGQEHFERLKRGDITWQEFVGLGIVEILDAEQQEHSLICPSAEQLSQSKTKWTHCEIHPLLVYGVCASIIPYSANNPSPRLSYFASMAKSSVAVPRLDFGIAPYDQHVLRYPQKPLSSTKAARLLGMNESPICQNLVVAVCSYEGYGQEDAIVACKAFTQRGGMVSDHIQNSVAKIDSGKEQLSPSHCQDVKFSESCQRLWCKNCGKKVKLCPECESEYVPSFAGHKGIVCRKKEDERRAFIDRQTVFWNRNPLNQDPPGTKEKDSKQKKFLGKKKWECLCEDVEERPRLDHLDSNGVVEVGEVVEDGDILIAVADVSGATRKDESVYFGKDKKGCVTSVSYFQDTSGHVCIRVAVATTRIPETGDKATSFHSQKGVFSLFESEENMPFTSDAFSATHPDFLINPLAFPSRMTIGQPKESNTGKMTACAHRELPDSHRFEYEELYRVLAARIRKDLPGADDALKELERRNPRTNGYSGSYTDCTPFTSNYQIVEDELKKRGYSPGGKEFFIDGRTGKKMEVALFVGSVAYNRLKHMVDDKMHARSTGKIQSLTRQPTEGRSRNGGLKTGIMERDSLVGSGATFCLRDRFFLSCDKFEVWVCKACGLLAVETKEKKYCRACHGKSNVVKMSIPYSTKLGFQELMAMGVTPRILVE